MVGEQKRIDIVKHWFCTTGATACDTAGLNNNYLRLLGFVEYSIRPKIIDHFRQ